MLAGEENELELVVMGFEGGADCMLCAAVILLSLSNVFHLNH